jgi:hypothetical protein
MNEGWIKLSRGITENWIWKDPVKLKWWLDMLINVNFKDSKVNLGNQIIECKRGQSVMSLQTWANRWIVDKNKVRNFFILLQKDKMITIENIHKSTRITICNYDSYQAIENAIKTDSKRNRNANKTESNTIEEREEEKRKKEEKELKDKIIKNEEEIFNYFKEVTKKAIRTFDAKAKTSLKERLKSFDIEDVKKAILNCYNDEYHISTNHKYLTLEFILREDKLNKFSSMTPKQNTGYQKQTALY